MSYLFVKASRSMSRTTPHIFAFVPITIFVTHNLLWYRQAMIDEFDLDQDGEINEQEFFAIMTDDA